MPIALHDAKDGGWWRSAVHGEGGAGSSALKDVAGPTEKAADKSSSVVVIQMEGKSRTAADRAVLFLGKS
jgi:hypothetical protein